MNTNITVLETDYLVVGAGVSGMAFVDELIHGNSSITVIIVDKHTKPGGHWNDAYSFVKLHQPARYYGVNSKELGDGSKDLASFSQISTYYELVMKDMLETGRVKFFPQCEYMGNGVFHSMLAQGLQYKVNVRKKTVDATYIGPKVPSKEKPKYEIEDGVNWAPINGLSTNEIPWERYVIIGGGKTGMDAILFLLSQFVNADHITWVIPNDYWLLNREMVFTENICNSTRTLINCVIGSKSVDEFYQKAETVEYFHRLDPNIEPTKMKFGTVSRDELEHLRRVKDIIRKGRIKRIEITNILFDNGDKVATDANTLHVDCSANGLLVYTPQKIFNGHRIILQEVKLAQSAYSGAIIGAMESYYPDEEDRKNETLKPIPHPQTPLDFFTGMRQELLNDSAAGKTMGFITWNRRCRLQPFYHISLLEFIMFLIHFSFYERNILEAIENILADAEANLLTNSCAL